MNANPHRSLPATLSALMLGACLFSPNAAPIPGLFSTGVSTNGVLLGANQVDPHYTLIQSDDPAYPGPNAYTLVAGFPVGPWLAEGPDSRWIAPRAQQGTGNAEGSYTFRTTFDLTGFDPAKARIAGKWSVDNSGLDILLNGVSLGLANAAGFGGWTDFTLDSGFVAGPNTLDFVVYNAPATPNPTGLRVELRGTVELPNEPPRVVTAPTGGTFIVGQDVTLTVVADGTPPLTYQWKRDGTDVAGATEASLALTGLTGAMAGDYTVRIANNAGQTNTPAARIVVLDPLPKLFNTGVDDQNLVLFDGFNDLHYKLVANPDDPAVSEPLVQDSTVFPIVAGPWIANSETSVWIGPRFDTTAAAGGDYLYELEVDLTGFDPTTAFLAGRWATDNTATLLLNGAPTGNSNSGNFDTLSAFRVETGFLSGKNKLGFKVNNASAGYTGLRVQDLRGGARKGSLGDAPRIVAQPAGGLLLTGDALDLTVLADGAKPIAYQWRRNATPLPAQTNATLALTNVTLASAGDYTVVVANFAGSLTSVVAQVTVLTRVPGVFSTGVDAAGVALADAAVDPHYKLTLNPDNPGVADALVEDSTVFPIVDGTWFRNSERSKWIGPRLNTVEAVEGDYTYALTFDLTGFDPATAVLLGGWATDNLGTDIRLNGQSTGLLNTAQFSALTPLTLTNGFKAGTNTLEFLINNSTAGYTGLRTDNLRVGAMPAPTTGPKLALARSGPDVLVSWPASATGFKLFATATLSPATWTEVTTAGTVQGDTMTVKMPLAGATQFYRLQK